MRVIRPLIKFMLPHWKLVTLGLLLAFLTMASNMGLLITAAYLLSWAALRPPILELMTLVAGVRFFGLSRAAFRYGERYVTHRATLTILERIRILLYNSLAGQSPGQLMNHHSGRLLSRIVGDVETLKDIYLRILIPPATAFLIFLVTVVFLSRFHWVLVLGFTLFYGLAALVTPLLIKGLTKRRKKVEKTREDLNMLLVDSLKGLTEITAFNQAQRQIHRLAGTGNSFTDLQRRLQARESLTGALTQLAANLALLTTLWLAVALTSAGKLPGIWIAALALGVLASFEAIQGPAQVIPDLKSYLQAGQKVIGLINTPSLAPRPTKMEPGIEGVPQDYSIKVTGLSFGYPGSSQLVLRDINFHLPSGGKLIIAGPSGGGKSTLVQILLGFWPYKEGSILIGGRELNTFTEAALWSAMGLVSRETYLFNATVKENLLLAKPSANEAELTEAAQKVHLMPHLKNMPQGWDTKVGEGGWKLSGGQRQLLSLARMFLKNPPILILDEATEGLDPVTEKQVLAAMEEVMTGRTTIMVTHRQIHVHDGSTLSIHLLPAGKHRLKLKINKWGQW